MVLLYDCGTGTLELVIDNIKCILGIDWQMLNGSGDIRLLKEKYRNRRLFQLLRPETFQTGLELMERTVWNNPYGTIRKQSRTMSGDKDHLYHNG